MADDHAKRMQKVSDQFHNLVGLCITEWAQVDSMVFGIFSKCVHPLKQAAIIYYRSPGIDVRLNLTDEIVNSVFPKPERKSGGHKHPLVKKWSGLKTDIADQLSTRRRIAHQPVRMSMNWLARLRADKQPPFSPLLEALTDYDPGWFMIYANEHERMREKESDTKPLTDTQLLAHLKAVYAFEPRLMEFDRALAQALLGKFAPPDRHKPPPLVPQSEQPSPKGRVRRARSSRK